MVNFINQLSVAYHGLSHLGSSLELFVVYKPNQLSLWISNLYLRLLLFLFVDQGGVVLVTEDVGERLLPKFAKKAEDMSVSIVVVPDGSIEQLKELVQLVANGEVSFLAFKNFVSISLHCKLNNVLLFKTYLITKLFGLHP